MQKKSKNGAHSQDGIKQKAQEFTALSEFAIHSIGRPLSTSWNSSCAQGQLQEHPNSGQVILRGKPVRKP